MHSGAQRPRPLSRRSTADHPDHLESPVAEAFRPGAERLRTRADQDVPKPELTQVRCMASAYPGRPAPTRSRPRAGATMGAASNHGRATRD